MTQYIGQKGSYINHNGNKDVKFIDDLVSNEINGALVDSFDVYGKISATGIATTAIFISENAYVKNINIHNGAKIEGDIVSRWNSVYGGKFARVQNPTAQPLITDLNFKGDNSFSANIYGETQYIESGKPVEYNTLKMNVEDNVNLTLNGNDQTVSVYQIKNDGNIYIDNGNLLSLKTLTKEPSVVGKGTITIKENAMLDLDSTVKNIDNIIILNENSNLSVLNDVVNETIIKEVNVGGDSSLYFDYGDIFTISSATGSGNLKIGQIELDEKTVKGLKDGDSYTLFKDKSLKLIGFSNVYYNKNGYKLEMKNNLELVVTLIEGEYGLENAIDDPSTPNYIVAEDEVQKKGDLSIARKFEISGYGLDFEGQAKGLIIKSTEANVTIKTHVYGSSDTDLTVTDGGKLTILSLDKGINIGKSKDSTAIKIGKNSIVNLKADKYLLNIVGKIVGEDREAQLILTGTQIVLNNIDPVTVKNQATDAILDGISENVVWNLEAGNLTVAKNEYLSDKNNEIIFNGGALNLSYNNKEASAIKLANMEVNKTANLIINIDLKAKTTDTFSFEKDDNVKLNSNDAAIYLKPNLLNSQTALKDKKIIIPFTKENYHNKKLTEILYTENKDILTPIYKYNFGGKANETEGYDFVLSRWDTSTYEGYNESILVAPIATQVGAYLTQLNSYETIFNNANLGKMAVNLVMIGI